MLTQKREIIEAIRSYQFSTIRLFDSQRELKNILVKESDGSTSEEQRMAAWGIHESVERLIADLKKANEALSK